MRTGKLPYMTKQNTTKDVIMDFCVLPSAEEYTPNITRASNTAERRTNVLAMIPALYFTGWELWSQWKSCHKAVNLWGLLAPQERQLDLHRGWRSLKTTPFTDAWAEERADFKSDDIFRKLLSFSKTVISNNCHVPRHLRLREKPRLNTYWSQVPYWLLTSLSFHSGV